MKKIVTLEFDYDESKDSLRDTFGASENDILAFGSLMNDGPTDETLSAACIRVLDSRPDLAGAAMTCMAIGSETARKMACIRKMMGAIEAARENAAQAKPMVRIRKIMDEIDAARENAAQAKPQEA